MNCGLRLLLYYKALDHVFQAAIHYALQDIGAGRIHNAQAQLQLLESLIDRKTIRDKNSDALIPEIVSLAARAPMQALRLLRYVLPRTNLPETMRSDIAGIISQCTIQFVHKGDWWEAKETLESLRLLESNKPIPKKNIFRVLEAIRVCTDRAFWRGDIQHVKNLTELVSSLP
ncbi:hypothetical protein DM02DRAFT_664131 [Periconia macrospinosa]|uniref:Uncharacterized protein n=1 Tax=Periconia macrospinosa TaxID=97972 RepID=A0A2V1CZW2_9PLEO|nr:hypothetical protein DM02DRAFT_664131 [Periconia macrospinosa]